MTSPAPRLSRGFRPSSFAAALRRGIAGSLPLALLLATAATTGAPPAAAFPEPLAVDLSSADMLRLLAPSQAEAAAANAPAAIIPVTSCSDDGSAGTLRMAIQGANDGDVVSLAVADAALASRDAEIDGLRAELARRQAAIEELTNDEAVAELARMPLPPALARELRLDGAAGAGRTGSED